MAKGKASLWTRGRKLRAKEMYEQGCSLQLVADRLGSNTGRVAEAIRSVGGTIRHRKTWTRKRVAEAARLYSGGCSLQEVAATLGSSQQRVLLVLRAAGVKARGRGAPRERNRNWSGGRILDKAGYALVKLREHPHANSGGYVREHRLVMEDILGRLLHPAEVVHHRNGDRRDNRPENLELFRSNGSHLAHELAGRRPEWSAAGLGRILHAKRGYWRRVRKVVVSPNPPP